MRGDPEALASRGLAAGWAPVLREAAERAEALVARVLAEHPELESLAAEVAEKKRNVVERLDYYIDRFVEAAERAGAEAVLAETPGEAREAVAEAVRDAEIIVMSKSMVAEEIGLRRYLESLGHEVWETDLGALLVQLEGGEPSHPIAPALHLSREDAARLLRERLGLSLAPGSPVEAIVAEARKWLREKMAAAGAGVTGANAIAADTGAAVMVENEANIRLVSSLPPVHVVVTGVEKIMPSLLDAVKAALVQAGYAGLYPPTYVNIVAGPSSTADIGHMRVYGAQGPRRLRIVLLDNGRRRAAAEKQWSEVLRCIRCGRCLFSCPVWRQLGPAWGGRVYKGPMGIVWSLVTGDQERALEASWLCLLCGRCDEACPMAIPLSSMIRVSRRLSLGYS